MSGACRTTAFHARIRGSGPNRADGRGTMVVMRGVASIGVLGVAACTVVNPAYETSGDGESGVVGGDTTEAATTADTLAGTESSGGPAECELPDARPLLIELRDHEAQPLAPDCSGLEPVRRLPLGRNIFSASQGTITHVPCDVQECPCPSATGPSTVIELGDDVPFAEDIPLPDCGRVELWPTKPPEPCEWAGVVLYEGQDSLPKYIASRTLEATPLDLGAGPLTLELRGEGCAGLPETCEPSDPGGYALGVYDATVMVGSPDYVDVAFLMGALPERFYFDNRMSAVTRECDLQLAWTAQHFPE
jgi:hypothetical protein